MQGRRRLIVDVDDAQLRYNSPDFCHEAMAEFVELLVLPLTTALENLNVSDFLIHVPYGTVRRADDSAEIWGDS